MLDHLSYRSWPEANPVQDDVHLLEHLQDLVIVLLVREEDALVGRLATVVDANIQIIVFGQTAYGAVPALLALSSDSRGQSVAYEIQPPGHRISKEQPACDVQSVADELVGGYDGDDEEIQEDGEQTNLVAGQLAEKANARHHLDARFSPRSSNSNCVLTREHSL